MIGFMPASAMLVSRSSRADSGSPSWASPSVQVAFRSSTAFFRPAYAASLKDWSPRPPTSYARPTLGPSPLAPLQTSDDPDELLLLPQPARARAAVAITMVVLLKRRKGAGLL